MFERYKKTFWGMQALICAVVLGIFVWSQSIDVAALFFTTMQVGALVGASWANRLKRKVESTSAAPFGSV